MHRDIPFALDPSLRVTFDWGDPYWKMVSAVSDGCGAADALGSALALAQLLKEARASAWVYEFGIPGVLTHAVCVAEVEGEWWVEDPFFDTSFKTPLVETLIALEGGGQPDRSSALSERICLVRTADAAAAHAHAALASRELSAIGDVRRFAARLGPEAYLTLLDDPEGLREALEDRGLPYAFDWLMVLPLRGLDDGQPLDLTAAPGDAGAWFAARLGDKRRGRRDALAQERTLARLGHRAREQRKILEGELVAASARAVAESARSHDLQRKLQSALDLEAGAVEVEQRFQSRIAELAQSLEAAETRADALQRRATEAEAAQARLGQENEAAAAALRKAEGEAALARDEVKQLEQRLEQLRAGADDASREAAAAVALRAAAEDAAVVLRQELAASADRAAQTDQRLEATRGALARARARALAALHRAAGTTRELGHMSEALEETRRAADRALDDLRARHEGERARDAERLREVEASTEALRADLATLAAGFAEQGARAQVNAAELQGRLARVEAELRSTETANQALSADLKQAAAREADLTATTTSLLQEMSGLEDARRSLGTALKDAKTRETELETAGQSLSLALKDSCRREADLEAARRSLTEAVSDAAGREAALINDTEGLRSRVAELEAAGEALSASLEESEALARAAQAADTLKARVLENLVRRAAAIGNFQADDLDPFDALDRLTSRLADVAAEREALAGKLAAEAARRDKRWGARIGRALSLVRKPLRKT